MSRGDSLESLEITSGPYNKLLSQLSNQFSKQFVGLEMAYIVFKFRINTWAL